MTTSGGGGEPDFTSKLVKQLEAAFGKVKVQRRVFEHCGVMHTQAEDGSVELTQDHYVKELKPIPLLKELRLDPSLGLSDALHNEFLTLLGGVGWTLNTRHDCAVYAGPLQRAQQHPCIQDVISLNRIVKWMRRKPCVIKFAKLRPPLRILCISDSAFKRTDDSCLACKGHVIALAEQSTDDTPGGNFHVLEAVSRRQRRVNRSTFAAEVNGLADAMEPAKVIAMQFAEATAGCVTAQCLARMLSTAAWPIQIEAVIDAKGVFDAIVAPDAKLPVEESFIAVLQSLREQFAQKLAKALWWVDTEDMFSDALTKGSVAREALLQALGYGRWQVLKPCKLGTVRCDAIALRSPQATVDMNMSSLAESDSYFLSSELRLQLLIHC